MKKIKTIFAFLCFTSMATIVYGKEAVYYHMFSKGAPTLLHSQVIVDTINENKNFKINLKPGLVCSAKDEFNKDKNPAMIEFINYRIWQSLQEGNDDCNFDLSNVRFLSVQPWFYNICVLKDSPIKTAADLRSQKKLRFGNGGGMGKYWVGQITAKNGLEWTQSNFSNSNNAVMSLIAKEVDVAYLYDYVSQQQEAAGTIRCLSYGNPVHEKATEKLLPEIPKILSSYSMLFVTGVKNVDEKQYQQLLNSVSLAKPKLDKNFKDNRLLVVGKDITELEISRQLKESIQNTYISTKDLK